jgi:hypothetical protein
MRMKFFDLKASLGSPSPLRLTAQGIAYNLCKRRLADVM